MIEVEDKISPIDMLLFKNYHTNEECKCLLKKKEKSEDKIKSNILLGLDAKL